MNIFCTAKRQKGLTPAEIRQAIAASLAGRTLKNVLILPPDYTRYHSGAGFITNTYYHLLKDMGVRADILPALGTHVPVTREQAQKMFGDVDKSLLFAVQF